MADPQRINYPVISSSEISANNQVIGFRNRIINGAMRIDQRNVNTLVTATNYGYCSDRWSTFSNFTNLGTMQNLNPPQSGSAPPKGQTNYINWTNSGTLTTNTALFNGFRQCVEGNNMVDFFYGTTNAVITTVSFWVYTSVVGNYSFCIRNGGTNYSYATSYLVSVANVWQYVQIVIAGAPAGTWSTDINCGAELMWGWHGSTSSNVAPSAAYNTWSTNGYIGTANMVNLGSVSGSSFNLSGAQWEIGSLATKFEWRPMAIEWQLCQRYYEKSWQYSIPANSGFNTLTGTITDAAATNIAIIGRRYRIPKRTTPTVRFWNYSGTLGSASLFGSNTSSATVTLNVSNEEGWAFLSGNFTFPGAYFYFYDANADF